MRLILVRGGLAETELGLVKGSVPGMSIYARELAARQQRTWERSSVTGIPGTAELKKAAGSELPPTFQQRKEVLQALAATPVGRNELDVLASQYQTESGKPRPESTPVLTYILLHEQEQGLIRR